MRIEDEILEIHQSLGRLRERSHNANNLLQRIEMKLDKLPEHFASKEKLDALEKRIDRMQKINNTVILGLLGALAKIVFDTLK